MSIKAIKKLAKKISKALKMRSAVKNMERSISLPTTVEAVITNEDTEQQIITINATQAYRKSKGILTTREHVMVDGKVHLGSQAHLPPKEELK